MYLAILVLLILFSNVAAGADTLQKDANIQDVPRFLRVSVMYITDRNKLPATKKCAVDYGPHRKYLINCKHDPYLGSAYSVIENVEKKPLTPYLKSLGWEAAAPNEKEVAKAATATVIEGKDFADNENQFYGKLTEQALLAPDKTFVVFAHGYKYAFLRAVHSAARIAYYAERPLVLYSWPSVSQMRSYDSDENNVEWSQEHFNDMVIRLEKICSDNPNIKMRMYAHSMGNRLVLRASPFLREQPNLLECALICPDVDQGLVQHYAKRYLSTKGTTEFRLYMSQKDKALAFSQLIHGGYLRLGECADSIGSVVSNVINMNLAPDANQDAQSKALAEAAIEESMQKTRARMQTIDFTKIDKGFIGHSIPAKLICSMSDTGKPCVGLICTEENSGERGRVSNFFSKLTKITYGNQDISDLHLGHCLRVIPSKKATSSELETAMSHE